MRTAINSFIFVFMVGMPLIVISLVSPGPFAGRLLVPGIIMIAVGAMMFSYFWMKGKKADQERDEREVFIFDKATKLTFYVMAVAVQIAWAYNFSLVGDEGDNLFALMAVFWGSFLAGIAYYSFRV